MSQDPSSLLDVDAILLDADVTDRDAAIHLAATRLAALGAIDSHAGFTSAVIDRESLHSTALPCGIAFPHARSPLVRRLAFAVLRPISPLSFDGTPVSLVFLIATPPDRTADHLALLAWLSRRASDPDQRSRWLNTATPQDWLAEIRTPSHSGA